MYIPFLLPFCCSDVSKSMSARQKLETQLTENNIVKEVTQPLNVVNCLIFLKYTVQF